MHNDVFMTKNAELEVEGSIQVSKITLHENQCMIILIMSCRGRSMQVRGIEFNVILVYMGCPIPPYIYRRGLQSTVCKA